MRADRAIRGIAEREKYSGPYRKRRDVVEIVGPLAAPN